MTSLACFAVLALLCSTASGEGRPAVDAFQEEGRGSSKLRVHDVHLLVTRNGFSCTNICQKMISKFDAGRGNMLDPQLSSLGRHGSREAQADVAAWLQARNRSVDALLSSALLRAMETGLLMYPEAGTLHVAPSIREEGRGKSNRPDAQHAQVDRLLESVPRPFQVDYRFLNSFRSEASSWPEFLRFLQQVFLPDFTRRFPAHEGPITVAVVTHAHNMRDGDVGAECKSLWTSQGESKPRNNQVLRIAYKFATELPSSDAEDVTPKYSLVATAEKCEQVSAGQRLKSSNGKLVKQLCLSDIGLACIGEIKAHSWSSSTLWEATVEKRIVDLVTELLGIEIERERAEQEVALAQKRYEYWCAPAVAGASVATCRDVEAEMQRKIGALVAIRLEYSEKDDLLKDLLRTTCWAGGKPNVLQYTALVQPPLGLAARRLLAEARRAA